MATGIEPTFLQVFAEQNYLSVIETANTILRECEFQT